MEALNKLPITLGTIIKINNTGNSSSSDSTSPSDSVAECRLITDIKKDIKVYSRLLREFDQNLGLVPYLPPIKASYEPRMNQAWNIAPYFLDILPQSSCCDLNGCILLLGGLNPIKPDDFVLSSSIFEFNESSQTWRYYGSMLEPRCYHAVCFVDSFLYITGGYSALRRRDGEMLAIPSTDRLDIRTTLWKRCADMKIARACHAIAALGKHLYVFGGRNSSGSITASVEMYDTEKDVWMEITRLPHPSMGLSATCVNNQVWILGGITENNTKNTPPWSTAHKMNHNDKSVVSDVYTFIPSNKSWRVQAPLPEPHAFTSCISSGNTIWVVGGAHSSEETLVSCPSIWRLKLKSGEARWKMAASLSEPTHSSCTVLCGKDLFVFGGIQSAESKVTDTVEIFNTETGILRKGVRLPAAIAGSSAVFLDKKTSNIKARKIVKNLISPKKFASKRDLHQTKLNQKQISSLAESAPEEHHTEFHSKSKHASETNSRFSENILPSMIQEENIRDQRHNEYEEESSFPYSDNVPESDVSKSSQDKSSEAHATYSSEQPGLTWTTKAHLHVDDRSFDSENKGADTNFYFRERSIDGSSWTDKLSDDYTQRRAELYRRNCQVKQMYTKDRDHFKNVCDLSRNRYVTTLEAPMGGTEENRKYHLNNFQPMKTEMILEKMKWNQIYCPYSDSGSISDCHNFKLYSPPQQWKMR